MEIFTNVLEFLEISQVMDNSNLLIKFLNNKDEISWYERKGSLQDQYFKEKMKNCAGRLQEALTSICGGTFAI